METSDSVLLERSLDGDAEAYGALVRRHQDAVFNLLVKMTGNWHDADELTQEAFLRAYRKLATYDARYSFKNWIITIAVNLTKNRFRSVFRRRRTEDAVANTALATDPVTTPADPRLADVDEALAQLPVNLRAPLVLRHLEGFSYQEIARTLGVGVSAAKMRVMRARDELVQRLERSNRNHNNESRTKPSNPQLA